MIYGILVKCIVLIAVIHGLRAVGRRIGPRASGLILGLPSSTAIVLLLCGCARGCIVAAEMAESSLLGLVAAVSLPLAYAEAVRQRWRLPVAIAAAVAAYLALASGLGSFHPGGACESLGFSLFAIVIASYRAGRIAISNVTRVGFVPSARWSGLVRTVVPTIYVLLVGIAGETASPSWAGLISTFPSMSMVLLIVTHLEEGPAEASRIARALPMANLSTAAFLGTFRFLCPILGLGWGMIFGYILALFNLGALEWAARHGTARGLFRPRRPHRRGFAPALGLRSLRTGIRGDSRSVPGRFGRRQPARRRHFAPLIEMLPC